MRDKNTALGLLANNIELPSMLSTVGKIKEKSYQMLVVAEEFIYMNI